MRMANSDIHWKKLILPLTRVTWLICGVTIFWVNVQAQQASNISDISVYVSSLAGERLTKESSARFTSNRESSLPVIKIDESVRFQKIEGFGATFNEAGMICLNSLTAIARNNLLKSLFDSVEGAGYTLMKSPMAACDFSAAGPWYSYDETPGDTGMSNFSIQRDLNPDGQVSFIKNAALFGRFSIETTMDFSPDWMMYGLKNGDKHIRPEYYSALAKYYSLYIQAYAAQGISINYLNPFNEAANDWYSNVTYSEIRDLIKFHIGPRLRADGLSAKIQLCETANRPEGLKYLPIVLDDTSTKKYINSLSLHGYDWDQFASVSRLHKKYPDLPIWMTEVCYAMPNNLPPKGPAKLPVYEFSDGEFWGNMIMNDMKNWISAWIYWNMILDQDGGPWLVSKEHGDPEINNQHPVVIVNRNTKEVTYTGLYYYLAHFSKFVRPGAYRIDCSGGSDQLNFTGFKNSDSSIVLNIINNGVETKCKMRWRNRMIIQRLQAHSITTLKWKEKM